MPDATGLRKKFRELPKVIDETLTLQIEKEAEKLVRFMRGLLATSWPALVDEIDIDWTWGDAPRGAVKIASYRGKERARKAVTIYAFAQSGTGIWAGWFEFGTAERVQKKTGRRTGRIVPRPYFFPAYRGERDRIQSNLRSALRRAIKKMNA